MEQAKKAPKKKSPSKWLSVIFEEGTPKFNFHGDWTGRDISLVQALSARRYRAYQRDRKLEGTKLTGGTSNESSE